MVPWTASCFIKTVNGTTLYLSANNYDFITFITFINTRTSVAGKNAQFTPEHFVKQHKLIIYLIVIFFLWFLYHHFWLPRYVVSVETFLFSLFLLPDSFMNKLVFMTAQSLSWQKIVVSQFAMAALFKINSTYPCWGVFWRTMILILTPHNKHLVH